MKKFNVAYFTASCDTEKTNKEFAESLKLDYPILSDPDGKVAKAYGIHTGRFSKRVTFVIGKGGKLLHVDDKVKAGSHGKDVVALLEKLKVEKK